MVHRTFFRSKRNCGTSNCSFTKCHNNLATDGSTRKSYLRRIFGGFGDDSKQRQDIEAGHANKKHKLAPSTAETSMQSTLSDNTKPVTDTAMQDQSQLSAVDIQLQELHPTAEEIARYMARTREYNEL